MNKLLCMLFRFWRVYFEGQLLDCFSRSSDKCIFTSVDIKFSCLDLVPFCSFWSTLKGISKTNYAEMEETNFSFDIGTLFSRRMSQKNFFIFNEKYTLSQNYSILVYFFVPRHFMWVLLYFYVAILFFIFPQLCVLY